MREPDVCPARRAAETGRRSPRGRRRSNRPASVLWLFLLALWALALWAGASPALEPRPGWEIIPAAKSYTRLVSDLRASIRAAPINIVAQASASDAARAQGHPIPGNRVIEVFRNDYARRLLAASVAAGIEAPLRLYVVEAADGNATLAYKRPSHVFAPYYDEGGQALRELAAELDSILSSIAAEATGR